MLIASQKFVFLYYKGTASHEETNDFINKKLEKGFVINNRSVEPYEFYPLYDTREEVEFISLGFYAPVCKQTK